MSTTSKSEDQMIVCVDCGEEFPYRASEQTFYRAKGYQTPKRCANCRHAKRARRGESEGEKGGKR